MAADSLHSQPAGRTEAIVRPSAIDNHPLVFVGFLYRFGLSHGRFVALPIGHDQNG